MTNKTITPQEQALQKTLAVNPHTMMRATAKANSRGGAPDSTSASYYYGNIGDSIERRLPDGLGNGSHLGGSMDLFQGAFGAGTAYPAVGFGNYFGGAPNGQFGGRFGPFNGGVGGFSYLRRNSTNAVINHQIIASCMMAYLGYGVVRNIIDLYTDFATEGVKIIHPDASVQKFYDVWAEKVGLEERILNIFMNMFVTGNVFVHRRWASLTDKEKRAMKRAEGAEKIGDTLLVRGKVRDTVVDPDQAFMDWFLGSKSHDLEKNPASKSEAAPKTTNEESLPENRGKKIPWGYTLLNPLQMEVRGKRIQGQHYWVMALDRRDTLDIAKSMGYRRTKDLGVTEVNLPKEFSRRIKPYTGPGAGYVSEIKLTKEELSVIQGRKFDWWDWAVPFVWPALRALNFKDCLRNMEMKACTSVINSVVLFKLGNIEKGLPAEDEHFERLADMLQMPGQALNIIWNEAIEADVIQPDVKGIFDPKKHESADRDILTALGVPEVLLGGKGGNFSNSFIAVSQVLERLESARNSLKQWLMNELRIVAEAMGFRKLPEIRFGRTSLTDTKSEQTFMLGLFDRGILSADTALQEANTSFDIEAKKQGKEKETQEKKSKVMEVKGPFIKDEKPPVAPGAKPPAGGKPKPKPKTPNGRPGGTSTGPTGKQSNPRGPKGQGLAGVTFDDYEAMLVEARASLDKYEDLIAGRWCKGKNIKYVKQAPHEERERLEQLVYNVFSHMPTPTPAHRTDDFIIQMLDSDAAEEAKADVLSIYHRKLADYKTKYGKAASREMRRQFIVSAWTQHAITSASDFQPI